MWIPRPLYEAIPYGYIACGAGLLVAALLVEHGPRGLLLVLGASSLTAGLVIWMRRRDYRAAQREYDTHSLDD
jgi:threonine dehydrogenase-like Zn-dependent dehydrogenase